MWSFVKERWGTLDTRTLGLFRVAFGLLLLGNLLDRTGFFGDDLVSFYSNEGIWPNHYALFLPPTPGYWSLLSGFSTPNEVRVAMAVIVVIYVLYTLGWKTRLMQVLALLCVESVNFRFLLPQHGGTVVMNILAVWTVFLPLGDRFSLDALLASLRHHDGATPAELSARAWTNDQVSARSGLAIFGVFFNYAAIYFFNTVHKQGASWQDGTAVHYLLWQNRMATSLAEWVRLREPGFLSPALTWGTLFVEGSLVVLLLAPFLQAKLRPLALIFIWGLHGSIALLSTIGPFSYSMMTFGLLCVTPGLWQWLERRWSTRPRVTVKYDDASELHRLGVRVAARLDLGRVLDFEAVPGARLGPLDVKRIAEVLPGWRWLSWLVAMPAGFSLARSTLLGLAPSVLPTPKPPPRPLLAQVSGAIELVGPALVLAAVISQNLMENWAVPPSLKPASRPEWMTDLINYWQVPQGWSMFAPDVPRQNTRLVVDATLADGTHVDPLTGAPPDFEPFDRAWFMNQHWCEVHARMPNWRHHWRNFKDYLYRRPNALGWGPQRQIVRLEVYQVTADMPLPGMLNGVNPQRVRLFGDEVQ